jgi:MerR family mercuric resistance operon transcriptional regulator
MTMSSEFTIGDLARRVGVNIETIRYYERVGIMPRPKRSMSGRRRYDESDFSTLTFIRKARELGFAVEDTRALLTLRNADDACPDVKPIAVRRLNEVRADLRRAMEVERLLSDALARCPGGGPENSCPVLKVLENAG